MATNTNIKNTTQSKAVTYFKRNLQLYIMLIIPVAFFIVFKYLPMAGVAIAFKDYNMFGEGLFPGEWVGFKHFMDAFESDEFWRAISNTLVLNIGGLLIGYPIPIILAVALNELLNDKIRKTTQIVTYLPHFLSWTIIAGISYQIFSSTGLINNALNSIGLEDIPFLTDPQVWRGVYWASGVWQSAGYSLIIYLAALMGVDTTLYEAASIDGATRMQRIWHITLPMIRGTITITLIMSIGRLMNISFEQPYMMSNALVTTTSEVISTYVYRLGITASRFDFATAIGLFQSIIGIILISIANKMAKMFGEGGLF